MQQPSMQQPPMPPSMQQPPMQQPPMPPSMQQPPPPPPAYGGMQQQPPPPAPMGAPPPPQGSTPAPGGPTLAAFYAGQRFVVNKDRFIIGRGKQSSDLTIKDPNVSRQHAMVEFLNGQYYMVDMGSTNGVEYNSQRIARKAIAEGDLYRICDHEVRFSYR
jgi:neural Wiskott-Aldrich syndrome protein